MQDYVPRKIDINETIATVSVKQFDNLSRFLHVEILDNDAANEPIGLNIVGCKVRMYVEPNSEPATTSNIAYVDGEIADGENGIVTFLLPNGITQEAGIYNCEIWLTNPVDESVLSTRPFKLDVERSIRNDDIIEATSQFSALENALSTVDSLEAKYIATNARISNVNNTLNGFNLSQKLQIKSVTLPSFFDSTIEYEKNILDWYLSNGCNTITMAVKIDSSDSAGTTLTLSSSNDIERMLELLDYATNNGCENIIFRFMMNYTAGLAVSDFNGFAEQYNNIVNSILEQIKEYKENIYCISTWNELYTMRTENYTECAQLIIDNIHEQGYRAMCSINAEQMYTDDVSTPFLFDIIGFNFYPWCGGDFVNQTWEEQIADLYAGKQPTGDTYSYLFQNMIAALNKCFIADNEVLISEIGCSYYQGGTNPTWKSDFSSTDTIDYDEQTAYYKLIFKYLVPKLKNVTGICLWTGTGIFSIYNNSNAAEYMKEGFDSV